MPTSLCHINRAGGREEPCLDSDIDLGAVKWAHPKAFQKGFCFPSILANSSTKWQFSTWTPGWGFLGACLTNRYRTCSQLCLSLCFCVKKCKTSYFHLLCLALRFKCSFEIENFTQVQTSFRMTRDSGGMVQTQDLQDDSLGSHTSRPGKNSNGILKLWQTYKNQWSNMVVKPTSFGAQV